MIRPFIMMLSVVFLLTACTKKEKEKSEIENVLNEPSEMSLLMRQMFEYNKVLKNNIVANDSLIGFPEDLRKIHSANLTDSSDRDSLFEKFSILYLQLQESVYTNKDSARTYFNRTISSCISCHEMKCLGPIPKIKGLLIE